MPTNSNECRCPVRPYGACWSSGSAAETRALEAWQAEHGEHTYAKARDTLARALQYAEGTVGSGAAVLNMVADVFGLRRESVGPQSADEAIQFVHERIARRAAEAE